METWEMFRELFMRGNQPDFRRVDLNQGVGLEVVRFQQFQPVPNQFNHGGDIKVLVNLRILFQIGQGKFEQGRRRLRPVLLQVHKRAGQLDQAFVECAVRPVFVLQPDMFEHLVRLKKKLAVETIEKSKVMRVELSLVKLSGHCGDAFVLVAHRRRVMAGRPVTSGKYPGRCVKMNYPIPVTGHLSLVTLHHIVTSFAPARCFDLVSEFCILHSALKLWQNLLWDADSALCWAATRL